MVIFTEAYKEGLAEIQNPKYLCPECGEPMYNDIMLQAKREKNASIGGIIQVIKQGHYACLNHKIKQFKCILFGIPFPEFILRYQNEIEQIKNDLTTTLKILKKKGEK